MLFSSLLRRGRAIALGSQLVLLVCSASVFLLMLIEPFPEGVTGEWTTLVWGLQVLPNSVLVAALLCHARWAPWFGLGAALVALGMQLPTLDLLVSWPLIARFFLWGLTVVGLLLDIIATGIQPRSIGKVVWRAILFGSVGLSAALLPIGFTAYSLIAATSARGGIAPQSDFASRRAWGERIFGPYLEYIDTWAALAKVIRRDLGSVQKIAPIGAPNRYQGGFTDGAYAVMNLEVIGTRGQGVLYLPYVEIWNTGHLQSIGRDASWTFAGQTHLVDKSGQSYLAACGLDDGYAELLELAQRGAANEFVQRWDDFEVALQQAGPEPPRFYFQTPRLISQLHYFYREPLLVHYGVALTKLNRNDEAAEAYRQAAATALVRAQELLQKEDGTRQLPRVAADLRQANAALKQAYALDADNQETLKLARERVLLQFLHSIGGRPRPVYTTDQSRDQVWAEKCLGIFYREAAEYVQRSPYLERALGATRVGIDPHAQSDLFVNEHNVYAASVHLQLMSRRQQGTLMVRIRENHQRTTPIDLFADAPRSPDYPLTIRSPYWTPEGGSEVKLSAKNGEPMRKKSESAE